MFLQGKRILFFSAHLFGYQNDIRLAMESVGAIVDYYDERPANNFLVKGVIRINRNLLAGYINHYYNKIIKETLQKEYDYVFFIKGESISIGKLESFVADYAPERTIKCPWFVKSPGPILQMIGCPAESSDLRVSSDQFVSCAEFIPSSEAPAVISVQSVPTSST